MEDGGGAEIQVLGTATCRVGGECYSFTARQRGVLAAVAAGGGRVISYEELYELIWVIPPSSARAVVHNAVGAIRRTVGRSVIESAHGGYRIVDDVVVDVERFLAEAGRVLAEAPTAVAPTEVVAALDLVRGRPFDDLLDVAPVEAQRMRIADVVLGLEDQLAGSLMAADRLDEALGLLQSGLVERPLREQRVALAMLALHRSGRSREALLLTSDLRDRQRTEAGLDVSPSVATLERRILADDPGLFEAAAIGSSVSQERSRARLDTELVGRDDLVSSVVARLDGGTSVLLHGLAGIGKSAVLQQVVCRAGAPVVAQVRCLAIASSPVEPVIAIVHDLCDVYPHVVRRALARVDVAALVRLVPRVAALAPPFVAASALDLSRERTDAAILGFLVAVARARRLTIAVDDVHLAPRASQRLLAEAAAQPGLTVVATSRRTDVDLVDGPGDVALVEVGGLTPTAVDELVAGVLGEPSRSRVSPLARQLAAVTGDNVFFLTSLSRHLRDRGAFRQVGGAWTTVGEISVPPDVDRFVASLLAELTPTARHVVEAVCIAASPVSMSELGAVLGLSRAATRAAVDEAVATGLLARSGSSTTPRHDIVKRAVTEGLSGAMRLELHVEWAEALGDLPDPPLARIAHHRFESRSLDLAAAVTSSLAAADDARSSFAHDFAVEHLRRARGLVDDDRIASLDIDIALGRELRDSLDPAHVEALLDAARRAKELDEPAVAARALAELGDVGALAGAGDLDGRVRCLVDWVLDALPEGADRARFEAAVSALFVFGDEWERGPRLWDSACRTAEDLGDPRVLADVYKLVDPVTAAPERLEIRERVAGELLVLGDQLDDPTVSYRGHLAMFAVASQRGDRDALDAHVAAMDRLDSTVFHGSRRRLLTYFQAGLAHLGGDLQESDRLLGSASSIATDLSPSWDVLAHASVLLPLRLEQGRLGELQDLVRALVVDQPSVGVWRAVLASASIAAGDEDTARAQVEQLAATGFASLARDASWLGGMSLTTEAALDLGRPDLAERAASLLRPFAGRGLWCGHAVSGLVDTTLGRVEAAGGRTESALAHLAAASEIARRLRAPIFAGQVLCERQRIEGVEGSSAIDAALAEADARGWVRLAENLRSLPS